MHLVTVGWYSQAVIQHQCQQNPVPPTRRGNMLRQVLSSRQTDVSQCPQSKCFKKVAEGSGNALSVVVHEYVERPFTCPQSTWTCWDKFHRFYLPNGLFSEKGNVRRSSDLAKLKMLYVSSAGDSAGADHQPNFVARQTFE
ncbi:hypothetical protein PPTG_21955 [Phytophthora nicotianae INRA-310]|uniref:Uncharacterized protein n=1 Tax=Phytophthora nicotianae (strain INRA-310) TaxID=761204 RepID=W2QTD9_PHYN3|nr:hypothetical protein PPTG_21955 [Phytophthora nicotianae INRA-310]ETN15545.1 hypothetical protein PPTG_21955 [Phytophthora nicotianae INRA-310]